MSNRTALAGESVDRVVSPSEMSPYLSRDYSQESIDYTNGIFRELAGQYPDMSRHDLSRMVFEVCRERLRCARKADDLAAAIESWVASTPDHPENEHRSHARSACIQIGKDIRSGN